MFQTYSFPSPNSSQVLPTSWSIQLQKNTTTSILLANYSLEMRFSLQCGWYIQYHSNRESWFSLFSQVLITESFLVRILYLLFILHAWTLSNLNLYMSWVRCPSLCKFTCVYVDSVSWALLCPEDAVSLEYYPLLSLTAFLTPLQHRYLSLQG